MVHQAPTDPTETGSQSRAHESPASTAVVRAVAAAAETTPEELPPLTDVIDPDALDALVTRPETNGSIRFQYAGYHVTVSTDGRVTVATSRD